MSEDNRPDPRVVIKVLCAQHELLVARAVAIAAETSAFHHEGRYYANAFDCSVAKGRDLDAVMRDLDRLDDEIMRVDGEIAVSECWTDVEDTDGLELHTIAAVLGVTGKEAA